MWIRCNPNPLGKETGDCVIRAIAIVTEQSWREAWRLRQERQPHRTGEPQRGLQPRDGLERTAAENDGRGAG